MHLVCNTENAISLTRMLAQCENLFCYRKFIATADYSMINSSISNTCFCLHIVIRYVFSLKIPSQCLPCHISLYSSLTFSSLKKNMSTGCSFINLSFLLCCRFLLSHCSRDNRLNSNNFSNRFSNLCRAQL